ncbi:unnamed protein product [Notodromas monacha]|uniref:Protein TEX261 n=1 Tax=Notodromas monacha TaxID=399045 RepID=A0A7R9BZJ0_9CRUS|nr:unnamed protein product [Notodromas monacha]CAG0924662.1 unnamed protein product [Notodromas monacha]
MVVIYDDRVVCDAVCVRGLSGIDGRGRIRGPSVSLAHHANVPALLLAWNHYVAFSYFSSKYFALSEILTYFTLFMWLVPFALLVSLSANDNVLPSYADAGEAHPLLSNHDVVSHYFSKRSSKKYGLLQALQSAKEYLVPQLSKKSF